MTCYRRLHEVAVDVHPAPQQVDWDEVARLWAGSDGVAGRDAAPAAMPVTPRRARRPARHGPGRVRRAGALRPFRPAAAGRHGRPARLLPRRRRRGRVQRPAHRPVAARGRTVHPHPGSHRGAGGGGCSGAGGAPGLRRCRPGRPGRLVPLRRRLAPAGVEPATAAADLAAAGAVWVPEGTPRRRVRALAPHPDAVLARGGAVLATPDGAAVAYLDGALLVSTVDPLAHFGHTAHAPAARFLEAFLPWVGTTLTPRGDLS